VILINDKYPNSMLLRPLLLAFAILISVSIDAIGAQHIEVDYRCDREQIFDNRLAPSEGWQPASGATIMLQKGGLICWARILADKGNGQTLSFTSNYASVQLYDGEATLLGSADRFGESQNAIITIHRALFPTVNNVDGSF